MQVNLTWADIPTSGLGKTYDERTGMGLNRRRLDHFSRPTLKKHSLKKKEKPAPFEAGFPLKLQLILHVEPQQLHIIFAGKFRR
jgi:hypothetical protein